MINLFRTRCLLGLVTILFVVLVLPGAHAREAKVMGLASCHFHNAHKSNVKKT